MRPSISYLFRILLMNPCIIFCFTGTCVLVISMWTVLSVYKSMKWICYGVYLGPATLRCLRVHLQSMHWSVVNLFCFKLIPWLGTCRLILGFPTSNITCKDLRSVAIQNTELSMLVRPTSCSWVVVLSHSNQHWYSVVFRICQSNYGQLKGVYIYIYIYMAKLDSANRIIHYLH